MDNTTDMEIVPRTPVFSASKGANSPLHHSARAADRQAERKRSAHGLTGGSAGALGSNAKLRATFYDPMESRVQRFALQSMARAILPESRTAKCLRIRAFDSDAVSYTHLTLPTSDLV